MTTIHTLFLYVFCIHQCIMVYGSRSCETGMIEPMTQIKRTNITSCFFPSSETQLSEFIFNATLNENYESTTIRAIGRSISFSANGMLDEYNFDSKQKYENVIAVNMSNMNQIIDIDLTANTITVQSGMQVIDVLSYLESINASLKYSDGPTYANIVGWFNSGTCGESSLNSNITSTFTSCMANNVIGLRMVIGNGSIIQITEDENSDLLDAVLISFGSLGIITQVTLSFVPNKLPYWKKYTHVTMYGMSNATVIKDTFDNFILARMLQNTTSQPMFQFFNESFQQTLEQYIGDNINVLNDTQRCWIDDGNGTIIRDQYLPCIDLYYKIKMPPPTAGSIHPLQSEFFLKQEYVVDAFLKIYEYINEQRNKNTKLWRDTYKLYRIDNNWDFLIYFKWVNGDDENHNIWLSPGYNETKMIMIGLNFHALTPDYIHQPWIDAIYQLLNNQFLSVTPIRVNWA
eukprot:183381_1